MVALAHFRWRCQFFEQFKFENISGRNLEIALGFLKEENLSPNTCREQGLHQ